MAAPDRPSRGHSDPGTFGARLRRARLDAGISQEELAERTGLSVRAISDLERGRTRRPYPHTVGVLVGALSISPATAAPPPGTSGGGEPGVPRHLPAGLHHFVGREREQRVLDTLADEARTSTSAVVISLVGGTGGVGKTALAVHWAHRAADRFGDGQLHVNLRGFGPADQPVDPDDALPTFLVGLGVAPGRIPVDLDARAAQYRSLLAGRRMLILLDNAADPAQVRPLLPRLRPTVSTAVRRWSVWAPSTGPAARRSWRAGPGGRHCPSCSTSIIPTARAYVPSWPTWTGPIRRPDPAEAGRAGSCRRSGSPHGRRSRS